MIAHGLPIVTTFRAGTDLVPLSDLLLQYVATVGRFTSLGVDACEKVLVDRLLRIEKLTGFAVELPQDAGLAYGEKQLTFRKIHHDAFEHLVHVEGFTWR